MDFIANTVDQLNWWAIILATLATLPVGFIWYDMKLGAGKRWAALNKLKVKDMNGRKGMGLTFTVMLITSFATAFVLACIMRAMNVTGVWESMLFGAVVGLILRGGAHFIHNGFTQRPMELTLIDAGHDIVSLAAMTTVLGLLR